MRLAFALFHGLAVDVHRCSDVGMAHQFLLHFDRSPSLIKKTPEGVAESVPAYAAYATAFGCGADMSLLQSPRLPGQRTSLERARENPILGILELRFTPPAQKYLGEFRIERHACTGINSFHVAHDRIDDAAAHEEREVLPDHVAPLEREELAAAEPCREIEDHHRAIGIV